MRLVITGLIVLIVPTCASAELLSTMTNRHVAGSQPLPASAAMQLQLDENDYDFYYRFPEVTPAEIGATFFVDAQEFIYGDNFFGVGSDVTTVWWNNFNRWLTDGIPSGDSATLITLEVDSGGTGGFSTSKECLAGITNCDNDVRLVETGFTSINGVDFAGYRSFAFDFRLDRFEPLDGGGFEFVYTWRLYGRPIPEPSSWMLAVFAWMVWHYQTPNFLCAIAGE